MTGVYWKTAALILAMAIPVTGAMANPETFGLDEFRKALGAADMRFDGKMAVSENLEGEEAFAIRKTRDGFALMGSDPTGVMYGFLELAEQVALADEGASFLEVVQETSGSPYLRRRGIARVITAENGDLSPWFRDRNWWHSYLDDLARNRFNLLELEGVYRIDERTYANALPYFIHIEDTEYASPSREQKQANLASLVDVTEYAASRGVEVAFVNTRITIEPDNLVDDYAYIDSGRDENIDFDWVGEGPIPGVGIDHYAIRWTGTIVPPKTGEYTFYTQADDGTRLWVNGEKLIDDWRISGIEEKSGTIRLEAGKSYSIRLEYLEWMYAAVVRLLWSPPGGEQEVVPASVLRHPESGADGLKAEYFTRKHYSVEINKRMTAALVEAVPELDLFGVRGPHLPEVEADLLRGTYSDFGDLAGLGALYANLYPEDGESDTITSVRFNGDLLVEPEPQQSTAWDFQRNVKDAGENTLWRLGTSGTVRLFRWFDPLFARVLVTHPAVEGSAGLVIEAVGAHTPQDLERFYQDPVGAGVESMADRQWPFRLVWGRLAYNSTETERLFRALFRERFGKKDGELLYDRLVQASRVLPAVQATLTTDINNTGQPPEFTFRAPVDADIYSRVFNERTHRRVPETVALYKGESAPDERLTSLEAAEELGVLGQALTEKARIKGEEAQDLLEDTRLAGLLAQYHDKRLRALVDLQGYYQTNNYHFLETAAGHLLAASHHWSELVDRASERYRPFPDPLTMGPDFQWSNQQRFIQRDLDRLNTLETELADVDGPQVGHLPYRRAFENQELAIAAGVLGGRRVDADLEYRTAEMDGPRSINMKRMGKYGVRATIPARYVEGDALEYRIVATRDGREASWPVRGWHRVTIVPKVE